MADRKLNIGIVGAGGFARFASKAFLKVEGVNIIAVTDINRDAASDLSATLNAQHYDDYENFLREPGVELVYIATPPYLHFTQSKMALQAGKHVISEKPAALLTKEAEELALLAASHQLLYVVNLMQRYNPMYAIVKAIINERLLGDFLHGYFENYASDEDLSPEHWFWNESKSGGIFIEHGVHFFDLFSGWLDEGKVLQSLQIGRLHSGKQIMDRVQATVLYQKGIVNFYHSFDQPKILDRQEMKLEFERGEITLYEWIPVKMKLHALLSAKEYERISDLLGDISVENKRTPPERKKAKGRFEEILYDEHVTFEFGNTSEKQTRYEQLLIAMLTDQWKWINNRNHQRIIDQQNGIDSLRMAELATLKSEKILTH